MFENLFNTFVADATFVKISMEVEPIMPIDTVLSFAKLIVALCGLILGLYAYGVWKKKEMFEFRKNLLNAVSLLFTDLVDLNNTWFTTDYSNFP